MTTEYEGPITYDEVKAAFESGLFSIENYDGMPICAVNDGWDNWFYFGGEEAELDGYECYVKNVPMEDIISEVVDVLDSFEHDDFDRDEWLCYRYLLNKR